VFYPHLLPLLEQPFRDPSICVGGDGNYYLTGTTGHPTWWDTNQGIEVWKSVDLKSWTPLGFVWKFESDATWQKEIREGKRAIWAPEIHFLKGTYWLAYSVNYGGTGLLKSQTGKPEGPYRDVSPDGPLTEGIDASLFEDVDGQVYFVFQNGQIARMNEAMTKLVEPPRLLVPTNHTQVGFEGAFLFRYQNQYFMSCAEFKGDEYDCMVAGSPTLNSPYGERYRAVHHGGHNMFFQDKAGKLWSTFFGNDPQAPFRERFSLLQIELDAKGHLQPVGTVQSD
jgi:beta-xylosidase